MQLHFSITFFAGAEGYSLSNSYTVEDLFNEYYAILKKRVGVNLTKGVYRKYELNKEIFYKEAIAPI